MIDVIHVSRPETTAVQEAAGRLIAGRQGALGVFLHATEAEHLGGLVPGLAAIGVPVFGGIFPGLIFDGLSQDDGILLAFFEGAGAPVMIPDLGQSHGAWTLGANAPAGILADHPSALVLIDGHSPHIGNFLEGLYRSVGRRVCYVGGGAGTYERDDVACLFVGADVRARSAVIVPLANRWSLGARHGWRVLHEPLLASRTRGNLIEELNWQPAYSVYRDLVEAETGRPFDVQHFAEVARWFPFGLYRKDAESVVRNPLGVTAEGALICQAEVPEHATLSLLYGTPSALLAAAREATVQALAGVPTESAGGPMPGAFVIDCIFRKKFLRSTFAVELETITETATAAGAVRKPAGLLTTGEIASNQLGALDFYNWTTVVGICHE
jgi:hypothetical protein